MCKQSYRLLLFSLIQIIALQADSDWTGPALFAGTALCSIALTHNNKSKTKRTQLQSSSTTTLFQDQATLAAHGAQKRNLPGKSLCTTIKPFSSTTNQSTLNSSVTPIPFFHTPQLPTSPQSITIPQKMDTYPTSNFNENTILQNSNLVKPTPTNSSSPSFCNSNVTKSTISSSPTSAFSPCLRSTSSSKTPLPQQSAITPTSPADQTNKPLQTLAPLSITSTDACHTATPLFTPSPKTTALIDSSSTPQQTSTNHLSSSQSNKLDTSIIVSHIITIAIEKAADAMAQIAIVKQQKSTALQELQTKEKEKMAATKIQAAYRDYNDRKKLNSLSESFTHISHDGQEITALDNYKILRMKHATGITELPYDLFKIWDKFLPKTISSIGTAETTLQIAQITTQIQLATIQYAHEKEIEDDIQLLQAAGKLCNTLLISPSAEEDNHIIESITGNARRTINPEWTEEKQRAISNAQKIFVRCKTNPSQDTSTLFAGYELLDKRTKILLKSAFKEKFPTIDFKQKIQEYTIYCLKTSYFGKVRSTPLAFLASGPTDA